MNRTAVVTVTSENDSQMSGGEVEVVIEVKPPFTEEEVASGQSNVGQFLTGMLQAPGFEQRNSLPGYGSQEQGLS